MNYRDDGIAGLGSRDAEVDDRRVARLEHIEELLWRGAYRVSSWEIVDAVLESVRGTVAALGGGPPSFEQSSRWS